ncbi:MAG: hypothetical protein M3H12_09340, partial [Chromatiales bacterium]
MNPAMPKVTGFKAGGIKYCIAKWNELTTDSFILQTVAGATLNLYAPPYQMVKPKPIKLSQSEFEIMNEHIVDFLATGIVEKVGHTDPEFISNVFMRDKKNGS